MSNENVGSERTSARGPHEDQTHRPPESDAGNLGQIRSLRPPGFCDRVFAARAEGIVWPVAVPTHRNQGGGQLPCRVCLLWHNRPKFPRYRLRQIDGEKIAVCIDCIKKALDDSAAELPGFEED